MTEDLLDLAELIAEQAAHMDAAQHRLLTNVRQFNEREGWAGAQSCAHWLAWRVGWTLGTAREHVRVAKALGSLPAIDDALRLGKVSFTTSSCDRHHPSTGRTQPTFPRKLLAIASRANRESTANCRHTAVDSTTAGVLQWRRVHGIGCQLS